MGNDTDTDNATEGGTTIPTKASSGATKAPNATSGAAKNGSEGSDYQYYMTDNGGGEGEDYDYTAMVQAEQQASGGLLSLASNLDYSDPEMGAPMNETMGGQNVTKGKGTNSSDHDYEDDSSAQDISTTVTGDKTIQDLSYDSDLSERSPVDMASESNWGPAPGRPPATTNTKSRDYDYDDYVDKPKPSKTKGNNETSTTVGKQGSTASPKPGSTASPKPGPTKAYRGKTEHKDDSKASTSEAPPTTSKASKKHKNRKHKMKKQHKKE